MIHGKPTGRTEKNPQFFSQCTVCGEKSPGAGTEPPDGKVRHFLQIARKKKKYADDKVKRTPKKNSSSPRTKELLLTAQSALLKRRLQGRTCQYGTIG
jgi:hypothetical protein